MLICRGKEPPLRLSARQRHNEPRSRTSALSVVKGSKIKPNKHPCIKKNCFVMYNHISLIRTFAGSANIQILWRYNEISTIVVNKCYGHVPLCPWVPTNTNLRHFGHFIKISLRRFSGNSALHVYVKPPCSLQVNGGSCPILHG